MCFIGNKDILVSNTFWATDTLPLEQSCWCSQIASPLPLPPYPLTGISSVGRMPPTILYSSQITLPLPKIRVSVGMILPTFKWHFCGGLLLPGDLGTKCPWMPTGATALLMMFYLFLMFSGVAVFWVCCCSSLLLALKLCFINYSNHRYSSDNLGKSKGQHICIRNTGKPCGA